VFHAGCSAGAGRAGVWIRMDGWLPNTSVGMAIGAPAGRWRARVGSTGANATPRRGAGRSDPVAAAKQEGARHEHGG
jgi:hypothetical protein